MAIYHFSGQVFSRSQGVSAVAAAAYRSGEKLYDERYGEHRFYKREVQPETEIIAPEHSPNWVYDRKRLWNEVEKTEDKSTKKATAQLAREINIALPYELSNDQQKELIHSYVKNQFVKQGMIADIAIHRDNPNNPHAHVMLTMRHITPEGFGLKNREWNSDQKFEEWREQWAHYANRALERAGSPERIDHRSHKERGLETLPTKHLGHVAHKMEQEGKQTEIGDYNRAVKAYNQTVIDLAKYREEKKEIEQQKEQQKEQGKHFTPGEIVQLKEAAKILKGYATLEKIQEHYGKLDKREERISKNIDYLNWKDRTIKEASSLYQAINNNKERIAECQARIESINWLNPFKLGENRAFKEVTEKEIKQLGREIEKIESKLNYHQEKLKFGSEQEFYKVRSKFDYDGLFKKNLEERKEVADERKTLSAAQNALEQGFVRQVAANYGEAHEMAYVSYKTAQTLQKLNENGFKTPEKIDELVKVKEQEIKELQGQLERVSSFEARIERAESHLNKHEEMAKVVQKMESSPITKAKMLVSKSAKADYERAVFQRDHSLAAAKAEGVSSKEDLTTQKQTLERMRANVPMVQKQLQERKKELTPYKDVQRGIQEAKRSMAKEVSRQRVGQRQRKPGMEREIDRGLYPKRNRGLSR